MTPATTPSPRISEEEYLQREREREEKYEFENGKEIPVGGATKEHNRIVRNLLTYIWAQLRELEKFEAYANDLRVFCPGNGKYYYPDLIITEGDEQYKDKVFDTLLNPSILIEVLSSGTQERDRTTKFEAYRSIDSFREYLLVWQDQHRIEGFYKNDQGEWIIVDPVEGPDKSYSFKTIDPELPLKEVYNKVAISESE